MKTVERRSLAVEDRDLAQQIGARLKAARARSGMTQQQVAAGRYTKAYVSALENGLIKPSMAALRFLAVRLGTTPSDLLTDPDTRWRRIDAELHLAAGEWQVAVDDFNTLLAAEPQGIERGLIELGLAEGLSRLGRPSEALRVAASADALLSRGGRSSEARLARYWLAAAHHQADNSDEARRILDGILRQHEVSPLAPDFHVRVLTALASVLSHAGEPRPALALLEEARGIGADMDDRRRAGLLTSLALGYRTTGDMEAAVRTGLQALTLFQSADAVVEAAAVENELALTFLALGNLSEAKRHATEARRTFERLADDFWLAHVGETEAQIALAKGHPQEAAEKAATAADLARKTGNHKAEIDAMLTEARAARSSGDQARSLDVLAAAAKLARKGPKPRLREILVEWSDLLAETGEHARAYELSREALALA